MDQKTVIGGVIAIIIIIGGVLYFNSSMMGGDAAQSPTADTTSTTPPAGGTGVTVTNPGKDTATFRSIFAQSGSHECKYDGLDGSSKISNVIYIADGKMRGEFRTTNGTGVVADMMIYDGGLLYSWKEGASVGKKTSITSIAQLPHAIPSDLTSGAVLGTSKENISWDCHFWIMNAKLLALPTYVKF